MKPDTIALLCSPSTHSPLRLERLPVDGGAAQEFLVAVETGEKFAIRAGIPLLLDEAGVTGFNQQYQRFYNRIAGFYDATMRLLANLGGGGEAHDRGEYLQEVQIPPGARVLEVSIGTGANLRYLPAQAEYYGLDLSWGMLQRCQRNLGRWGRAAELVYGNAEALPFRAEVFDVVFHVGGINAFNDRAQALREMIRVAKPGTRIVIVDETAQLIQKFSWAPSARRWLSEHGERFSAPLALVPETMQEVRVKDIVKGNMYCLSFRKP